MTDLDERPSLAEQHAVARESSNLRVKADRRGDADILIASAWAGSGIGAMLWDIRGEWDAVFGTMRGTNANEATDVVMAMMALRTLSSTKQALGALAWQHSQIRGMTESQGQIFGVVGMVLAAFLHDKCLPCDGRGFTGGGRLEESGPRIRCSHCRETGKRRAQLGHSNAQREFAKDLLNLMDQSMEHHRMKTQRLLRAEQIPY